MPVTYLDFLSRFSPLNALIQGKAFVNGLHLYGAHELLQGQDGYARNPTTGRAIAEWPKDLVVVGHDGADPFCIDCSKTGDDAPVLTAEHGRGTWEFTSYARSFTDFLKTLSK